MPIRDRLLIASVANWNSGCKVLPGISTIPHTITMWACGCVGASEEEVHIAAFWPQCLFCVNYSCVLFLPFKIHRLGMIGTWWPKISFKSLHMLLKNIKENIIGLKESGISEVSRRCHDGNSLKIIIENNFFLRLCVTKPSICYICGRVKQFSWLLHDGDGKVLVFYPVPVLPLNSYLVSYIFFCVIFRYDMHSINICNSHVVISYTLV